MLFLTDPVSLTLLLTALGSVPTTADNWFALLQSNRAVGVLKLFFTELVAVVLLAPRAFALYGVLRRTSAAYAALAAALGLWEWWSVDHELQQLGRQLLPN